MAPVGAYRRVTVLRQHRVLIGAAFLAAGVGVYLAVAGSPGGRPDPSSNGEQTAHTPTVRFTDVTAAAGIRFRHFSGAAGQKLLPETMGGGVAVIDFERDGRPDHLFVNGRQWPGRPAPHGGPPTLALYRNKGDGT